MRDANTGLNVPFPRDGWIYSRLSIKQWCCGGEMKRDENWCNVGLFMRSLRHNLPLQQTYGNLFLSQFTKVWDSDTFVSFSCIKLKNLKVFNTVEAKSVWVFFLLAFQLFQTSSSQLSFPCTGTIGFSQGHSKREGVVVVIAQAN